MLILDDYHTIEQPVIDESMAYLLAYLPSTLHLMIASRRDPRFSLALLRASGQVLELSTTDLAFSLEEARAFLSQTMKVSLADKTVAALHERTEGLAVGLQLVALAIPNLDEHLACIRHFDGNTREVTDYFMREIFNRQPAPVQLFLLSTAPFERLSASFCDALTSRADGYATLNYLEQENLFLTPLGAERNWFRYHPLFRAFLRHLVQQTRPDLIPLLHQHASVWYEKSGLIAEAIEEALVGEDYEHAARLLVPISRTLARGNEVATLLRWCTTLPDTLIRTYPALCVHYAWMLVLISDLSAAESWLQHARSGLGEWALLAQPAGSLREEKLSEAEGQPDGEVATLLSEILMLEAYMAVARQDHAQCLASATHALEYAPPRDVYLRSTIGFTLGLAQYGVGQLLEATRVFSEAWRASQRLGDDYLAVLTACGLATTQAARALPQEARATYQQVMLALQQTYGHLPSYAGMALVGEGGILYGQNRLDEASQQIQEGMKLSTQLSHYPSLAYGSALLALIEQAQQQENDARELIEQAEGHAREHDLPFWEVARLGAYHVQLYLMWGELEAAAPLVKDCVLGEFELATKTRLFLAQQQPEEMLSLIEPQLSALEANEQRATLMELRVLQALAYERCGKTAQSFSALQHALALAEPGGYIRVFLDEGPPMARLLTRLLNKQKIRQLRVSSPVDFVKKILNSFGVHGKDLGHVTPSRKARVVALSPCTVRLTGQQAEVLRCLVAGMTTQEIADKLVISVHTVYDYTKKLCALFQTKGRTQLVAKVNNLGILDKGEKNMESGET